MHLLVLFQVLMLVRIGSYKEPVKRVGLLCFSLSENLIPVMKMIHPSIL